MFVKAICRPNLQAHGSSQTSKNEETLSDRAPQARVEALKLKHFYGFFQMQILSML